MYAPCTDFFIPAGVLAEQLNGNLRKVAILLFPGSPDLLSMIRIQNVRAAVSIVSAVINSPEASLSASPFGYMTPHTQRCTIIDASKSVTSDTKVSYADVVALAGVTFSQHYATELDKSLHDSQPFVDSVIRKMCVGSHLEEEILGETAAKLADFLPHLSELMAKQVVKPYMIEGLTDLLVSFVTDFPGVNEQPDCYPSYDALPTEVYEYNDAQHAQLYNGTTYYGIPNLDAGEPLIGALTDQQHNILRDLRNRNAHIPIVDGVALPITDSPFLHITTLGNLSYHLDPTRQLATRHLTVLHADGGVGLFSRSLGPGYFSGLSSWHTLFITVRGTNEAADVVTDAQLAVGALRQTERYKHDMTTIYNRLQSLYNADYLSTVDEVIFFGHSLGGSLISAFDLTALFTFPNSNLFTRSQPLRVRRISLNKGAVTPDVAPNELSIRTFLDPISLAAVRRSYNVPSASFLSHHAIDCFRNTNLSL
jgi:hypothetical protein